MTISVACAILISRSAWSSVTGGLPSTLSRRCACACSIVTSRAIGSVLTAELDRIGLRRLLHDAILPIPATLHAEAPPLAAVRLLAGRLLRDPERSAPGHGVAALVLRTRLVDAAIRSE